MLSCSVNPKTLMYSFSIFGKVILHITVLHTLRIAEKCNIISALKRLIMESQDYACSYEKFEIFWTIDKILWIRRLDQKRIRSYFIRLSIQFWNSLHLLLFREHPLECPLMSDLLHFLSVNPNPLPCILFHRTNIYWMPMCIKT